MDKQIDSTSAPGFLPAQIGNVPITMSSVEIADLTGKRHDNVMRDTRKMLVDLYGEGGLLKFEDTRTDPQNGKQYPVFRLPKRESLILVSGYSVELRARIIDRWMELEAGQGLRLPTTAEAFASAFTMLAEQERKHAVLEAEQSEQAKRIATTERRLDQIETAADHFTCLGYARYVKQTSINLKDAASLGQRATKRCRELGITIGKVPDPRFGAVNQFPKAILDEVWDEKFGAAA
jgi:Rha family phage regulatory protein